MNTDYSLELKQMIINSEKRLVFYKKMLNEVYQDKLAFPENDPFVIWYKAELREDKNNEQLLLKYLIAERKAEKEGYHNTGLTPLFTYRNLPELKELILTKGGDE